MSRVMSGGNTVSEAWTPERAAEHAHETLELCSEKHGKVRRSVPPQVERRYAHDGSGRYYRRPPVGGLAFTVCDSHIRVDTQISVDILRSLAETVVAWGWKVIAVSGAAEFRRQVWRECYDRGLDVRGYEPSERESAEAADKRRRRETPYAVAPAEGRPDRRDRLSGVVIAVEPEEGRITVRCDGGREVTKAGPDIRRALACCAAPGGEGAQCVQVGERVTIADVGVHACPEAPEGDERPGYRRRFVIERAETDFEARLAATLAEFAPAKPAEGSSRLKNSRLEADERQAGRDMKAIYANGRPAAKGIGNGGAAQAARKSAEGTADALKAARLVAEQAFAHDDERARFIAAVRKTLHDLQERR